MEYFYESIAKFKMLLQLNESENVAAAGLQRWKAVIWDLEKCSEKFL